MSGKVTILGAGPGNPELLTLLAERKLAEAEVVLYGRLIDDSILLFAPAAIKIDVGKLPHYHKVKQYEINKLLIKYAREGKNVVRVKAVIHLFLDEGEKKLKGW